MITRVETAVENMRSALERDRAKDEQKRKHKRYEKRTLFVEVQMFQAGTSKLEKETFRTTVSDVSAGGMRIDVSQDLGGSKGQRMKFSIMKPDHEVILAGTGQVVRVVAADDGKNTLGIQFGMVMDQ